MAKQDRQLRAHWDSVKQQHRRIEDEERIEAIRLGGRIQIIAPYRTGFPSEARAISGKWRFRSRCWSFPASTPEQRAALTALLTKHHPDIAVPDLESLSTRRAPRIKATQVSDACQCIGDSHIWNPVYTSGNTCQCGDLILSRNGDGWEVRIR